MVGKVMHFVILFTISANTQQLRALFWMCMSYYVAVGSETW